MDIHSSFQNTTRHAVGRTHNQSDEQALFMRQKNERMAGSAPEWRGSQSAREDSVFRLSEAAQNPDEKSKSPYVQSFKGYMVQAVPKEKAFGVGDIIDMVNPLHHLPLVGPMYRSVTDDDINPAGRVIGGTVFGGILGGATSMANIISEEETGRDLPGLAFDKVTNNEAHSAYHQAQKTAQGSTFDNQYRHEKPQYNE